MLRRGHFLHGVPDIRVGAAAPFITASRRVGVEAMAARTGGGIAMRRKVASSRHRDRISLRMGA